MQAMYFKLNICLGFHTLQNHSQVLSKLAGMSPTKIPKIYTQDDPKNKNHAGEKPLHVRIWGKRAPTYE